MAEKEQRRYIAFQILSQAKLQQGDIHNAVWQALLNFLGELGTAEAEAWPVRGVWDDEKQQGLVRCGNSYIEKVRTALALMIRINDVPVCVRVLGVSGTVGAAQHKYFGERDLTAFVK
ncbi:MAG: Rpp14/Pop5 family protein [Candidatus Aenigmatarchaeota archaeon]